VATMEKLYDRLINKKLKITEIPKWGPYLRKQWEINFANHLSIMIRNQFTFFVLVDIAAF
jgi:hypothetical protein